MTLKCGRTGLPRVLPSLLGQESGSLEDTNPSPLQGHIPQPGPCAPPQLEGCRVCPLTPQSWSLGLDLCDGHPGGTEYLDPRARQEKQQQ